MELDPMPKRQVYLSDEGDAQAKSSIISFLNHEEQRNRYGLTILWFSVVPSARVMTITFTPLKGLSLTAPVILTYFTLATSVAPVVITSSIPVTISSPGRRILRTRGADADVVTLSKGR